MTKDKILIFKSYKAMHQHALRVKEYYFSEQHARYLATDPDACFILTEHGELIRI